MRKRLNYRLLLWLGGGLALASVVVWFLHDWQVRRNADVLLDRGDRARDEGQLDVALAAYTSYLSLVPDDVDALEKYARALDVKAPAGADRVRLILLMQRVLHQRPQLHDLRLRLVHNLIMAGRVPDAVEQIGQLKENWPNRAELTHLLGWCQEAREQFREATDTFREAIRLDPKQIDSYSLLAEVLNDRLFDSEEAGKVLDAMIDANGTSARARLIRARFLLKTNQDAAADADLAKALELAGTDLDVVLTVSARMEKKGEATAAAALLEKGITAAPHEPALYTAAANFKIRANDRAAALAILKRGLDRLPGSLELGLLQADLLIDTHDLKAAERKVKELSRNGANEAILTFLQARLAIAAGRHTEARPLLERARAELAPKSDWQGRANALLGVCYRVTGDTDQELAAMRRAVDSDSTWGAARVQLAAALLANDRVEEAIAELEKADDVPAERWTLLARALILRNLRQAEAQRDWVRVNSALSKAEEAKPNATAVAVLRAQVQAAGGDAEGAAKTLRQAIDRKPKDRAEAWCALAELQASRGQPAAAEKTLAQAEADVGDGVELRLARCRLWGSRGNGDDRRHLLDLGARLDRLSADEQARLRRELAETWQRLGERERAEALWTEIARAQPLDLRSRGALLEMALHTGQIDVAHRLVAEMRKIEGADGTNWRCADAAVLMHEAHADRKKLAEARQLLDAVARKRKDWPRVPLLLARADEMEGRYRQAIAHYTQAVELGELKPAVVGRLVSLLLERRESLRAEDIIQRYRERQPWTRELARLGTEVALGNLNASVALERAAVAVTLPSRDYRDHLWLARVRRGAGEPQKAEEVLRTATKVAGHAVETWVALAEHLALTGRAADAEKVLDDMKKSIAPARSQLALARCRDAMHQLDRAAAEYQRALEARADDYLVLWHAADFHLRADEPARAVPLLRRLLLPALAAPPELQARARRSLAVALVDAGLPDARREALDLLAANGKLHGPTGTDERLRQYVLGSDPAERDRAIQAFRADLGEQPATASERLLLARLLLAAGKVAAARDELQPLVADATPQILARSVAVLVRTDDLDEAAAQFARLERREPDSPRVRSLREALAKARAAANP